MESLWTVGHEVMGYSRAQKSLFIRNASNWRVEPAFQGQVERVATFADGLVLELSSGELAWHNGARASVARPSPQGRHTPGELGVIVSAAEADGLLALLGDNGRLALFDWARQAWLSFDGGPVQTLLRHGGEM